VWFMVEGNLIQFNILLCRYNFMKEQWRRIARNAQREPKAKSQIASDMILIQGEINRILKMYALNVAEINFK